MNGELLVELPDDASAPALARRYARELGALLPTELLDDAVVMVSELVTNAVRHGRPDITLLLQVSSTPPRLLVRVRDQGAPAAVQAPAEATTTQLGGRGLLVVEALASAWGTEPNDPPPGKSVWFEMISPD